MKNITSLFFLLLAIGCADKEVGIAQNLSMYDSPLIDADVALKNPYELTMNVRPTGANEYSLIASMKLFGGSFYVSPLSKGDFSGKFTVEVESNDFLKLGDVITETPSSKEVFDPHPFVNSKVNWVQRDTENDYEIALTTTKDFQVSGWVRFTIEPKCTFEEIPFEIISKNGVLTVQQYPKLDKRTCGEPDEPID